MEENKDKREAPNSIRFPDEIKDKIKAKARKDDRSFSWTVIKIVTDYFTKPKK